MTSSMRRALGAAALAAVASAGRLAAQAGQPAPPQITVGGLVYAQYLYQLKDTINGQNNFDITRGYVTVLGNFANGIFTRVTVDLYTVSDASGTGGANNDNGSYDYRLKYAYVAWTPNKGPLTARFGMTQTPWLDWEETLWDYRMQGSVAMDRDGYLTASDIGAALDGKWNSDQVNFQAGVYNGEGYHGGVGDQRKDVMFRFSGRLMNTDDMSRVGGLRLTVYGQYGKPTGNGLRERAIAMVSYRSKMLTLAGEAASTVDSSLAAAAKVRTNGHVYSAFGVFHFPQSQASIIARVDIQSPQTAALNSQTTRMIVGASYQIAPNLRVLADWDNLSYQGTPTSGQYITSSTAYFQTQFTF